MKKITLVAVTLLALTACKKEKYTGYQTFYWNEQSATKMVNDGLVSLKLYVDGELIGSTTPDVYYTSTPECKKGNFEFTEKMYKNEKTKHSYKVIDELEDVIWEGTFETSESLCNQIELDY